MNLYQDIRDTVSGFSGLFTTQDLIDALPGYKPHRIAASFRNLVWKEGIAEKTNPFKLVGLFRVVNNDESIRNKPRSSKPVSIEGKQYDSYVSGCRVKKWDPVALKSAFVEASKKVGYPVTTITFKKCIVTRAHNY